MTTGEQRASARAIRKEMLKSIPRWQRDLEGATQFRGTLGAGIAVRAMTMVEAILKLATQELLPDVPIRKKPAIGDYVNALADNGHDRKLRCSDPSRSLVTPSDVELLREFARSRATVAHQADREVHAELLGRLTPADVRRFFTLSERVVALPLVEELVCREGLSSSEQPGRDVDG